MGKVEIPEAELRQHKLAGMTDEEIGEMYGTDRERVHTLRRRYKIPAISMLERKERRGELHRCANPLCQTENKFRIKGYCVLCYNYHRRVGRHRFTEGYQGKETNTHTICRTCKQSRKIKAKGQCDTCRRYELKYGKPRRRKHWVRHEQCKVCGKPRSACRWGFKRGRCDACNHHWKKYGVERPPERWKKYCECGNVATHLDTPLKLMTVEKGVALIEHYDLCEDCWQLEMS